MARARFAGLRFSVLCDRSEDFIVVVLTIQDTHHYAGDFFRHESSDRRDYMLQASMLLDRMERELYKIYGISIRYPL